MSGPGGSSRSQDLPMTLLPLTSKHRDEIDQTVLKRVDPDFVKMVIEDEGADATTTEPLLVLIMTQVIMVASTLLKREHLKDNLDMDMASTKKTLQQHPKLRGMIRHACQTRSFSQIADLEIFQIPQASDSPARSARDEDRPDFLYESFVRPYIGKAVDGFYECLKNNNMKFKGSGLERSYYAKFCSIVQSSGTGKSRLMTELGNKGVIVLYMNLRDPSDPGFPMRDLVPARILTEDMGCTRAEYTARCCAFFTAIFQTLEQDLTSKLPRLRSGSPDPTIKSWNDEICNMRSEARTEFFQKVQYQYQEILNNIKMSKPELEEKTDANPVAPTAEETATKLGSMSLTDENIKAPKLQGESFVKKSYDGMLRVLQRIFPEKDKDKVSNNDHKLVIAFDEAHPLSIMSIKGFHPSHILGRTINCYSQDNDASVWVVFASTTSQVADFSAPQVIHDSLRVAVAGQLVYRPYTHLGWDHNADPLSVISANNVARFDHIVGFGCPLWKSLVEKCVIAGILKLAAQKLCKSKILYRIFAKETSLRPFFPPPPKTETSLRPFFPPPPKTEASLRPFFPPPPKTETSLRPFFLMAFVPFSKRKRPSVPFSHGVRPLLKMETSLAGYGSVPSTLREVSSFHCAAAATAARPVCRIVESFVGSPSSLPQRSNFEMPT
ncbi:hypothetical protein EV702DRAFT_1231141 [Suillus placidus]|uniref:Uncharacterized protein n=1 Tax=Suillus placidus TaxID=48579 RepID=A0A9P6ZTX7_9AGAM|nr:hypothetical protein EV702DRAFT_1231141 [Suillus placidus]